jgi:hypothetical protein
MVEIRESNYDWAEYNEHDDLDERLFYVFVQGRRLFRFQPEEASYLLRSPVTLVNTGDCISIGEGWEEETGWAAYWLERYRDKVIFLHGTRTYHAINGSPSDAVDERRFITEVPFALWEETIVQFAIAIQARGFRRGYRKRFKDGSRTRRRVVRRYRA